jgi:hypothetical protein
MGGREAPFLGGPAAGSRLAIAAVALAGTELRGAEEEVGIKFRTEAPVGRLTSQAEFGRSLR